MKRILLYLLVISVYGVQAQSTLELDSIVTQFNKNNLFNGSVLIVKGDKVLLDKGYGNSSIKAKTPNEPQTIYQAGSLTKQFTAAVVLKLQEEGKLSVKDKVSKYFPSIPYGDRITIHQLLTHTSGIKNYTADSAFMAGGVTDPVKQDKLISLFASRALDFEPGSKFNYSNSGYVLLGYIIEKVSGKSYEQNVRSIILHPLGMHHTGFDFVGLKSPNKATGYWDNGTTGMPSTFVDSTISYAAGSMYTTTHDLLKWINSINNKKILKSESWNAAFTPVKSNYGYGFIIDTVYGEKRIWHNGSINGFQSYLSFFPAQQTSTIIITNNAQSGIGRMAKTLEAAALNKLDQQAGKSITLPLSDLQQYEGVYQLAPTFSITIKVDNGRLMAQATNQPAHEIFAQKKDYFFYKVVEAQLEFIRDEKGKITKLILHQNGRDLPGEKIQ